ncbi:protein extra-macrochaetae [Lucilia sericata]|uniref:protein extra-macrochaetae n=1 Tax=Lucilia sericata TaxID=13632 RepID=UPI0018A7F2D5|nr:protein extra-macrochaetae [Lucilia sericata]
MKSLTAVCQTGASMPAINPNGRISRHPPHRGDGENAEMKMYLSKLKDLVPFMPKNRKLSKLEIIQHVIDYICDLQSELETHPEMSNFDAAAALNFTANLERVHNNGQQQQQHDEDGDDEEDDDMYEGIQERLNGSMQQSSPAQRQPLVDRQTPNTILPATQQQQHQQQQQQQMIVSAVNNTTTSNSITTSSSPNSLTTVSSATTTTAAAVATATASHTLINEKDLDSSSSRQSC